MSKKIVISFLIIVLLMMTGCNKDTKNNKIMNDADIDLNNYINIDDLSDDFIHNYFEEVTSITDEDEENLLICTSKTEPTNTYGAKKVIPCPNNQYLLLYDSKSDRDSALKKLKKDNNIISIHENNKYTTNSVEYNSWGIESMELDYPLNAINPFTAEEITVAVIDTGLDVDLFKKYYNHRKLSTYNANDGTTDVTDVKGHGTHVIGTITEATPLNVQLLAIKADSKIMHWFYEDKIIAAFNYITIGRKADIVNMSLGSLGKRSAEYRAAINAATRKNITVIASVGNDSSSEPHYPSDYDNVISVTAVDSKLNRFEVANVGKVDFAAPGVEVKSITGNDSKLAKDKEKDFETMSGTSMAAPHITASVAILKSFNKYLDTNDVIKLLKRCSIDLSSKGYDKNYGWGFVSFKNVEFCNGIDCDEYGIFKK